MRIWQLISCLAVTLSLWGAASAGASQRPARHGGRSLHITQDAGARVGTVSKSDSTISQFRPRSHLKPTGKGVGLSFVKSLVNLKGCAAGIKVPVSGQFSGWDKNKYLPKVNSFVGVQYPFDYRVAITSSYAFDPVIRGEALFEITNFVIFCFFLFSCWQPHGLLTERPFPQIHLPQESWSHVVYVVQQGQRVEIFSRTIWTSFYFRASHEDRRVALASFAASHSCCPV